MWAPCLPVHLLLGRILGMLILQVMLEEAEQAPSSCRPALRTLAVLYGATRVERSLSFFLGCGAIEPCCMAALRDAVNRLCRRALRLLRRSCHLTLTKDAATVRGWPLSLAVFTARSSQHGDIVAGTASRAGMRS